MALSLKTAEDAIAFFSKHGHSTPIKFFYCNRADTGDEFRPYDLQIVSRKKVKPEHFTVSTSGIVHIQPNAPSECYTLAEWVHQSTAFNILRSIRFFKHFLIAKAFTHWKSNVRYRIFCQQRKQLSKSLFAVRPSFVEALNEVHVLMDRLKAVQILSLRPTVCQLSEFVSDQADRRLQASKQIEEIVSQIEIVVDRVCRDVKEKVKAAANALQSDDNLLHGAGAQAVKNKSMAQARKEKAEKLGRLKHAQDEVDGIPQFIRLVDTIQAESLVTLCLTSADSFLHLLHSRKQALLKTSISFGDHSIVFSPPVNDVSIAIQSVFSDQVATIAAVDRIVFLNCFKPFLVDSATSYPQIDAMIETSIEWKQSMTDINNTITADFASAVDTVSVIDKYRLVFDFNLNWNEEEYRARDLSLATLQADLAKQKGWCDDVERNIRNSYDAGIFQVESKGLKESLLPASLAALGVMKEQLLRIFHSQCKQLHSQYQAKMKELEADPQNLTQFAIQVEKMSTIREESKLLEDQQREVEHISELLDQHQIRIPSTDAVLLDDLRTAVKTFDRQVVFTESKISEKMLDMRQAVYKNIDRLITEFESLKNEVSSQAFLDSNLQPTATLAELRAVGQKLEDVRQQSITLQGYQVLFGMDPYGFHQLPEAQALYQSRIEFWSLYESFQQKTHKWSNEDMKGLSVEAISQEVTQAFKSAHKYCKQFDDAPVVVKLKEFIGEWKALMPSLLELAHPAMKQSHWRRLFTDIGQPFYPNEAIKIRKLQNIGVFKEKLLVSQICEQAAAEYSLETTLQKVKKAWNAVDFIIVPYKNQQSVFILGDVENVSSLLDEHLVTLQTMLASRHIGVLQVEVEQWSQKLAIISELLEEWLLLQRNWMYLEPIFSAVDIQRQLPAESKRFSEVDSGWKEMMMKIEKAPAALKVIQMRGLLQTVVAHNKTLDAIQKQLDEYLETKRAAFPRFYFLSNDELLQILSQTRDPLAVQPHLSKIFDNISLLQFDSQQQSHSVQGLVSSDGEELPLLLPVKADGNVEVWLGAVEKAMREAVRKAIETTLNVHPIRSKDASNASRNKWLAAHPAQAVLTVDQIIWTHQVQQALTDIASGKNVKAMAGFLSASIAQIASVVDLVRGKLSSWQRCLLSSLLIMTVHARDVVSQLIDSQCTSLLDFEWTKQLRYFWEETEEKEGGAHCIVRQTNAEFRYGYEYLGNTSRLVITPLTDKAFLMLTSALHLKYGGSPQGPAGTGKTETVKDLAKALAIQVVVFNCSDGIRASTMGQFFAGLTQAGAWSCFDEFNRIDIEVLSVIAQQILTIQQAIIAQKSTFPFEGRVISANPNFGVFITMNPGNAGRTKLPDNLKALFRPIAMMIPDYSLIAQIILFSEGFQSAATLSKKMVQLYKLSSEQLSKQHHYDFGMRAVKSVLIMAGKLKRENPELPEDVLLIRAISNSNVPKFLSHDLPLFKGIISDLFPTTITPKEEYGVLEYKIKAQLVVAKLQPVPAFVKKIIQLHQTLLVRHGVMVVGATGSGKSTCISTLASTYSGLSQQYPAFPTVKTTILNPKALSMEELYGCTNPVTQEWSDGLVAAIIRKAVEAEDKSMKWVVFDGPIDALWIENMNTVLDDNKCLCLPNGERIRLPSSIAMLFEVGDLSAASPATVSRCGMVYLEESGLGWEALVDSWQLSMQEQLPTIAEGVAATVKLHTPSILEFLHLHCKQSIPAVDCNLVQSCLHLITALLTPENGVQPAILSAADLNALVSMYVLFSMVWSFGANTDDKTRPKMSGFLRKELNSIVPTNKLPPADDCELFDLFVDPQQMSFVSWRSVVPPFHYNPHISFFNLFVPTADSVKHTYLLNALVANRRNVVFAGETGVGKSMIVHNFFRGGAKRTSSEVSLLTPSSSEVKLDTQANNNDSYLLIPLLFSARTSSLHLQGTLEAKLEKKRRGVYGAPIGKKAVVFVDDLNMPLCEQCGAQPPIELLRQIIDQQGFYDRQRLFFKHLKDVSVISACAPAGGGRSPTTPRLLRHFNMIWMTQLPTASLRNIFSSILGGFINSICPGSDHRNLLGAAQGIVSASIALYDSIISHLLPTPNKSHYTFNLRDLSKLTQGILQVHNHNLPNVQALLRLWIHESARTFRDRLIDDEDRAWFDHKVVAIAKTQFPKFEGVIEGQSPNEQAYSVGKLLYGDYLVPNDRSYQQINTIASLPRILQDFLSEYNLTFPKQLNLVFFNDAIAHISRIARILRQPRGNALLVGVGGSGRSSLTRLAAFMNGYDCVSLEIGKHFAVADWNEEIKKLMKTAALENKPIVFLFSDTQVVHEKCLEDINSLLNAGEVPNLFEGDEIAAIITALRQKTKDAGMEATRENVLALFAHLVRENLHIVLTFSPVGDGLRSKCRQFPSLVNCCSIDWFDEWPAEALHSVAESFFSPSVDFTDSHYDVTQLGVDQFAAQLCHMCVKIHSSVAAASSRYLNELRRHNYTTPTSYLELIRQFVTILINQRQKLTEKLDQYSCGLDKLQHTNSIVSNLREELLRLQPDLKFAVEETAALLVDLEHDQKIATEKAEVCGKESEACQQTTAQVEQLRNECQKELNKALPAYEQALAALDTIKKDHITVVKSFGNPPALVVTVMEAVCLLFGKKPNWEESRKLLTNVKFLENCKNYDKDNIAPKLLKKLQVYIDNPEFVPEKLESVSEAAVSLCIWVRAMNTYAHVATEVQPKREALMQSEEKLKSAEDILNLKLAELKQVEDRVAELKAKYAVKMKERDELQHKLELTKARLDRAEKLVNGLGSEEKRWGHTRETLQNDMKHLIGNMLLAAGSLSYLGPFTHSYRQQLIAEWNAEAQAVQLPVDSDFSFVRILSDPLTVRDWSRSGLPTDDCFIQNGILLTCSSRWPLLIDPQSQANRFIKSFWKQSGLQCTSLSDPNCLRTIENAVRYGQAVLLEDVGESLDAALEPILLRQVFKKGGQWLIRIGDQDVAFSPKFHLFITTKLANPHYPPEVFVQVAVINFTVTSKGLEDQLLEIVCGMERKDLEERKDKLIVQISNDQNELSAIEKQILKLLFESTGEILDDEGLINALASSKSKSSEISLRMDESSLTMAEITQVREQYRIVAQRASTIYFVIADLSTIDPMYQYSLLFFTNLFKRFIEATEKSEDLPTRLRMLIANITENIFRNVCRGLFEKDRLLFAFLIAAQISRTQERISAVEWDCFVRGVTIALGETDRSELVNNPLPPDARPAIWSELTALETLQTFPKLFTDESNAHSLVNDREEWDQVVFGEQQSCLPQSAISQLSSFQQLLVTKVTREDRLLFALRQFIDSELGSQFTASIRFDLNQIFNDSTPSTPIVFVLSPGTDPLASLIKLAQAKGLIGDSESKQEDRFYSISLGQGQGAIAEELMKKAQKNGNWLCLQNCHLSASWLPRLEELLGNTAAESLHPDYRLWLTSMPTAAFPVSILQNSIKVTNEPPRGLRANILRSFSEISSEEFESCSKSRDFKKLLYCLAFFHAVVQERRKFGAVGWNIAYSWMNSDLEVSKSQLKQYLEQSGSIPWTALREVIGEINYGGRVTDDKDMRCVRSLLASLLQPNLLFDDYQMCDSSKSYSVPADGDLKSFVTFIDSLPTTDHPEVFGLHANADITFQLREAKQLMDSVVALQPRAISPDSDRKSPNEFVLEMTKTLKDRVPQAISLAKAHHSTFTNVESGKNPLGVFLKQEIHRINSLLSAIHLSLKQMERAIQGFVLISPELDAMFAAFLFNEVPELWQKKAYPSLKPLSSWVTDLIARVEMLDDWLQNGAPSVFWLSGFFFPQGFLTSALQKYARETKIPIDTLCFKTQILPTDQAIHRPPSKGVYVRGLFLEGARWESKTNRLEESHSKQLFQEMPVIWLCPSTIDEYSNSNTYQCPLYKISTRVGELSTTGHSTNFVFFIDLPTADDPQHWVRRGVALLSQLDD